MNPFLVQFWGHAYTFQKMGRELGVYSPPHVAVPGFASRLCLLNAGRQRQNAGPAHPRAEKIAVLAPGFVLCPAIAIAGIWGASLKNERAWVLESHFFPYVSFMNNASVN